MEITFLETAQVVEIQASTLPNSGPPDTGKLEGLLNRVHTLNYYEGCDDIFTLAGTIPD